MEAIKFLGAFAVVAALVWSPPASAQTFEDATFSSGAAHFDPSNGQLLLGTGMAWGDYDGDGDQDLYSTHWSTNFSNPSNALFANQGDGTFFDVAPEAGVDEPGNSVAAAWADYDNDGDLDLYVADFFDQDRLFDNNGGFFALGAASGTVDQVRLGNSTGVSWGDYDGDGWTDLYISKFYHANQLLHNNRDGTFVIAADLGLNDKRDSGDAAWVDYDFDGDLDLYVVNREQENTLYRNDGGSFAEVACALSAASREIGQRQAWGDYDNDGDLDLYLANVGANQLYRNDGSEDFVEVGTAAGVRLDGASWLAAGAAWADYDGDGWLDLYVASGGDRDPQSDVLLANLGDGSFREATSEAGLPLDPSFHVAAAWGDYDGDGAPDLYVADGLGPFGGQINPLYRNRSGADFIKIKVEGKGPGAGGSALDAFGTQVFLIDAATDALAGYRQVLSGGNAAELSFGAPAGPYVVVVVFPNSSDPVVAEGVPAGAQITVVEP
jgi:enediyne biosynthesis protein E4